MDRQSIISIEDTRVYFLYRRGEPEYIKALYEQGELYINTIDFIRTCDQNEDSSDPYDGVALRNYLEEVNLEMCEVGQDIDKFGKSMNVNKFVTVTDSLETGNTYCLSGIYGEHIMGDRKDIEFNTKSLGKLIILIHKTNIFINRVMEALKTNRY